MFGLLRFLLHRKAISHETDCQGFEKVCECGDYPYHNESIGKVPLGLVLVMKILYSDRPRDYHIGRMQKLQQGQEQNPIDYRSLLEGMIFAPFLVLDDIEP